MANPTFTRQHYKAVAGVLRDMLARMERYGVDNPQARAWHAAMCTLFSKMFAADNRSYKADKFIEACGYESLMHINTVVDFALCSGPRPDELADTREIGEVDQELAKEASDLISSAFVWGEAQEGHEYWAAVCVKLRSIGETGRI